MKLPLSFYLDDDVVSIAKNLLGKMLFSYQKGTLTGGIITETEAYKGIHDKACHAYGGRRTKRNDALYEKGGIAYVYLCYGLHFLLNVVTNSEEVPHAVLIRAITPLVGIDQMVMRRKKEKALTNGPGTLTQALGINLSHNKISLQGDSLWIEERQAIPSSKVMITPRIGVDYAKEDALLPYRFLYQP